MCDKILSTMCDKIPSTMCDKILFPNMVAVSKHIQNTLIFIYMAMEFFSIDLLFKTMKMAMEISVAMDSQQDFHNMEFSLVFPYPMESFP